MIEANEQLEAGDLETIRVGNEEGEPVQGAQIFLNDENIGATNHDGELALLVPADEGTQATITAQLEEGENTLQGTTTSVIDTPLAEPVQDEENETENTEETANESFDNLGEGEIEEPENQQEDENGEQQTTDDGQDDENGEDQDEENGDDNGEDSDGPDIVEGDNETDEDTDFNAIYSVEGEEYSGIELVFQASYTDADSYNWEFGDGNTETGHTTTHTYNTADQYTTELTVEEDGETDTVEQTITIEEPPEPEITFNQPSDGETITQDEFEAQIEINNAIENADYTLELAENTEQTQTLEKGRNTFTPTINTPATQSTLEATVQQGTQNQNQQITINTNQPVVNLISPEEGQTIEIIEGEDIEFTFQVENKGWADTANLKLNGEQQDTTTILEEQQYTLATDLTEGTHDWGIETTGSDQTQTTETQQVTVTYKEPETEITLSSPEDGENINDYEVTFDYQAYSEVNAEFNAEIQADENMERTWDQCQDDGTVQQETISYDEGETITTYESSLNSDQNLDSTFEESLNIAGDYTISKAIEADTEQLENVQNTFTTTEGAPEDTEEDCP